MEYPVHVSWRRQARVPIRTRPHAAGDISKVRWRLFCAGDDGNAVTVLLKPNKEDNAQVVTSSRAGRSAARNQGQSPGDRTGRGDDVGGDSFVLGARAAPAVLTGFAGGDHPFPKKTVSLLLGWPPLRRFILPLRQGYGEA